MKPLHLPPGSTGAAIRARPATPLPVVWVHRPKRGVWCALHRATGGRNIYLCLDWSPGNEPVHILTSAPGDGRPHNSCPACEIELAAGTPAAVAAEPRQGPVACTGLTARWCPRCGDCACGGEDADLNGADCPLHSSASPHAEPAVSRTATVDLRGLRGPRAAVDPAEAWSDDDAAFDHLDDLRPEEP